MLQGTLERLKSGEIEKGVVYNALIESFTIHARALIHFLYPKRKEDSDVLAADFFDDAGAWPKICQQEEPIEFGRARERVNKEIAHLTYDRQLVTPDNKRWNSALGDELLRIMHIFLSARTRPHRRLSGRQNTQVPGQMDDEEKYTVYTDPSTTTLGGLPWNVHTKQHP
jgi:hypothetical protein